MSEDQKKAFDGAMLRLAGNVDSIRELAGEKQSAGSDPSIWHLVELATSAINQDLELIEQSVKEPEG